MRNSVALLSAAGFGVLHPTAVRIAPLGHPTSRATHRVQAESSIVIRRGTRIRVELRESLYTEMVRAGGTLSLLVAQPVRVGERVAIPAGTIVDARVDTVRSQLTPKQVVELDLVLTQLRYPTGDVVRIPSAAAAAPNGAPGNTVRVQALMRGASQFHLASGSRLELVVLDAFSVDARPTVAEAPSAGQGAAMSRSRVRRMCWSAGTPGTPDILIPGTPSIPAMGDMPAVPGTPDVVLPGFPPRPGTWAPC